MSVLTIRENGDVGSWVLAFSYCPVCQMGVKLTIPTRLSNGFSRKFANLKAALSLWFWYYNFCRIHGTIKTTPAMAAGVTTRLWNLEELLA